MNPNDFYLWTASVISYWLLAAVGALALVTLLAAEYRFRRGRHLFAATFIFLWLVFDVFNGLGLSWYAVNVAWTRYARLWTILVCLGLAVWDLRNGRS